MANRIVFSDSTTFLCAEADGIPCISDYYDAAGIFKKINIADTFENVSAKFIDGAIFKHEWDNLTHVPALAEDGSVIFDANGNITYADEIVIESEDMSDYCVSGDIVLHKDATLSAFVRKKTEMEIMQEAFDDLLVAYLGGN